MKSKLSCLFLLLAAPLLHAQSTPSLMSYQSRVTDAAGVLIGNTSPVNRSVVFRLYTASSGGTALYAETQTVTISGGEFGVLIGNGAGITGSPGPGSPATTPYKTLNDIINSGTYGSLFLGVTVDDGTAAADPEIAPRQQIVSGAFALRAKVAESVAGGAVTTTMIGDGQISTGKIASSAVDSSRILDSSIVATDIANNTITAGKLDTTTIGLWTPQGSSVYRSSGNVGIGEANPGFPLNFASSLGDKISLSANSGNNYGFGIQPSLLQIHSDSSSSDIAFGYGNSSSSTSFTETMRIKGNGNVGIGINNPADKLSVNGNGRVSGILSVGSIGVGTVASGFYGDSGNIALRTPANGATYFQNYNGATTNMYIGPNGSVGIATTDLNYGPLTVAGNLTSVAGSNRGGVGYAGIRYNGYGADIFVNNSNWSTDFRYVNFDGDSNWDYYSDRRFKKDIVDAEPMLDRLMKLSFRRFRWKDEPETAKHEFGVIAQEVQPLFPDIVGENTPIGETDPRLTVGYSTFGTIACKALQEFKIQTDEDLGAIEANIETVEQKLTEELIEKEARISQLEARLAALEKLLPSAQ
jgi:hypothetical protein